MEAKKADGARLEQLRNPMLGTRTNHPVQADVGDSGDNDLNKLSQASKEEDEKAGEVCRMYKSFGIEKEWRRMVMALCMDR